MPNEITIIQIIIQAGAVGIALYLIYTQSKERSRTDNERKEEREKWYQTVNNHMQHDMELHERTIAQSERSDAVIKKLCKAVDGMIKKVNGK